jgi:hypothetical protein
MIIVAKKVNGIRQLITLQITKLARVLLLILIVLKEQMEQHVLNVNRDINLMELLVFKYLIIVERLMKVLLNVPSVKKIISYLKLNIAAQLVKREQPLMLRVLIYLLLLKQTACS